MKRILVADDNPVSRELIREVLESPERTILEAADGKQALDMITALRPDLVFLDIQMPVLDGFSVLRLLKEDSCFAGLRVIALTAFAMRGDREKALAAGFDGYITKPIDAAELERQVQDRLSPSWGCADGG